jgi:hypothetical protein
MVRRQCRDPYRDLLLLSELCRSERVPWTIGNGW